MPVSFENTTIIVTGGASGIGLSLSRQLLAEGATVIVVSQSQRSDTEIGRLFDRPVSYYAADLSIQDQAEKTFAAIFKQYPTVDYLINSAGIFMAGEIRDTPLEDWRKVVDNNIFAVGNTTYLAYQKMLNQGYGHIVNIASAAGLFPVPFMGVYGASKFALVGLGQVLRAEAAAFNIKVSTVCPTIVNTPLYDTAIYEDLDKQKLLNTRGRYQTPDQAARRIIVGIRHNRAIIHTSPVTSFGSLMYRLFPTVYGYLNRRTIEVVRRRYRQG